MKVLSLFDGISCGMVALERAGIEVSEYHACEIDKYAIQVSQKNYPQIVRHGSVVDYHPDRPFDLVIGGSPCQGFSSAGKGLAFKDPRSKLLFEYVRILGECRAINPGVKFLLENVKMKKEHLEFIDSILNVKGHFINSALVSAQNRQRYYWYNWFAPAPEDKKVLLKDIIDTGVVDREKSYCIDANYAKGTSPENYFKKSRRQIIGISATENGNITYRKLTPVECERLQTLPDNYTEGISNTQRYKCLGNGWTVDVIAHIFRHMNNYV
jgi:site-specific DNA-cytosine methylase